MSNKTYTESEIVDLLGRAARLQAKYHLADERGLTLEELKAAAEEAGIDPRFVDWAATPHSTSTISFFGIPAGLCVSRSVDGVISDGEWQRIVQNITKRVGGPGTITEKKGLRMWEKGANKISVQQLGNEAHIVAETGWQKNLEVPFALLMVGTIATIMMGMVAILDAELLTAVPALLLTLLVSLSFFFFQQTQQKRLAAEEEKFEEVLGDVLPALDESSAPLTSGMFMSSALLPDDMKEVESNPWEEQTRNRSRLGS